jgi:hypothetical protein
MCVLTQIVVVFGDFYVYFYFLIMGMRGIAKILFGWVGKSYLSNTYPHLFWVNSIFQNGMLHMVLREIGMLHDYATNLQTYIK